MFISSMIGYLAYLFLTDLKMFVFNYLVFTGLLYILGSFKVEE